MPLYTQAKAHSPGSLRFDAGFIADFQPIVLSAASPVNTTVETAIALPCNCKILQVSVLSAAAPTGTLSGFNIVAGTAAEGSTGTANTVAVSGTKMFAADSGQVPTSTEWAVSLFPVAESLVDVIWPDTLPLTVRLVGTTITGTYYVSILAKAYDLNLTKPLFSASGALQI